MSFLDKENLGANGKHFYFDGYRAIDALTFFSNEADAIAAAEITTTFTGNSSLLDKRNIFKLMEELDAIYMQNRMKDQFMRNNTAA